MPDIMQRMTQNEDWKREFWYVVFARRRPIRTTAIAVVLGAVLIVLFWPPRYEATASVLVRGKRADVSSSALDRVELRNPEISEQDVVSELEILRSPELASRVVAVRKSGDAAKPAELSRKEKMEEARAFLRNLDVTRVPASNVIRIRYSARSAQQAEEGLDALLNMYISYRAEVFNPTGQEAFFQERITHYREQLNRLMERIDQEGGDATPVFIDMKLKGNLDRLGSLQEQLGLLEMELATSAFRDNQPLLRRMQIVKDAITELESENRQIQRRRLAAESFVREAELISHSLDTFAQRAEEARIAESIAQSSLAGDVSILNRAEGTGELVFPKAVSTLVLGLIVALIAGLSVGFLSEFFEHTVRRPEDVARNTGLPVIGSLPKV